jgi:23S rRNA (uracil1939-C5)-methyltransferase
MELKKNMICTVTIDRYAGTGAGIALLNGLVIFVQGALRGEQCEIKLLKVKRTVAFAKVERILSPSPARAVPQCPYFPACGGCVFWHMTYEEELEIKRRQVEDALSRIGGFSVAVPPILGSETMFHYRNKAQFPVSSSPNGPQIGFYRARSHDVIAIKSCLIQSEHTNLVANAVQTWMEAYSITGYDESTKHGLVRHIYVRTNQAGEALVCIIVNGTELPHDAALIRMLRDHCPFVVGVLYNINQEDHNIILGEQYQLLWGSAHLTDELLGQTFSLSVPSFYQVNHPQAEQLYQIALSYAAFEGTETVLELYCGVGTISLSMAPNVKHVIGVEIIPEAVQNAKENALRNQIFNVDFFCADAGDAAKRLLQEGVSPDVIVVDPPRKGLDQAVIDSILLLSPVRIVYISCDPATLARDLKQLSQQGYVLDRVTAVDMFPRTKHVECVVLMSRTND